MSGTPKETMKLSFSISRVQAEEAIRKIRELKETEGSRFHQGVTVVPLPAQGKEREAVTAWNDRINRFRDTVEYPEDMEWLIDNVAKPLRERGVPAPVEMYRHEGMGSEKTDYFTLRWKFENARLTRIAILTIVTGTRKADLYLHRWRKNHEIDENFYELDMNDSKTVQFAGNLVIANQTV